MTGKDSNDVLREGGTLDANDAEIVEPPANVVPIRSSQGRDPLPDLDMNARGLPKSSVANAARIMRDDPNWRGKLGFDERRRVVVFRDVSPVCRDGSRPYPAEVRDIDVTAIRVWCSEMYGVEFSDEIVQRTIDMVSSERGFDPFCEYLKAQQWDGQPRLRQIASRYLGIDDNEYTASVLSKWMISGVARSFSPGAQVDTVLVLEGVQGVGKTTLFRTLGGPYYAGDAPPLGSKDAKQYLLGPAIVELQELDSLRKVDIATVKAFISARSDRFRPPYGRREVEYPRRCVFGASTNDAVFLRDATGGRRFWCVRVGRINIEALERDRDLLWAEAVHRFMDGEAWHLQTKEEIEAAKAAQEGRREHDPWEGFISDEMASRKDISIRELLSGVLQIPIERQTQRDQNRVARILQAAGWRRRQVRRGRKRDWVYEPASSSHDQEV